jgi:hypothetical protein
MPLEVGGWREGGPAPTQSHPYSADSEGIVFLIIYNLRGLLQQSRKHSDGSDLARGCAPNFIRLGNDRVLWRLFVVVHRYISPSMQSTSMQHEFVSRNLSVISRKFPREESPYMPHRSYAYKPTAIMVLGFSK